MARTMLNESGMEPKFPSFSYQLAAYIINQLPNLRTGNKSPLELLSGTAPNPAFLYPFGAKAIVHIPAERRGKLDERGQRCRLLGFPPDGVGWLFGSEKEQRVVDSTLAIFPFFQSLPVQPLTEKPMDIINHLRLREEDTDGIAAVEQVAIEVLPKTIERVFP